MIIDTHSHMYASEFEEDREACMLRAKENGVGYTLLPNIDASSIAGVKSMMQDWPDQVFGMMGLHPCSVKANYEEELNQIKEELDKGGYVAVGEIGLDFYWDKSFIAEQTSALKTQISWAKELALPIVLHVRDSFQAIFDVLDEVGTEGLSGVFHCFTGDTTQAQKVLSYPNFYIGLGGVLTFKNSGLDKVVVDLPLSRLMLETDAPYLSPAPHRGKRNETAYTKLVAQKLADIYSIDLDTIAHETSTNARKLFKI